MPSSDVLPTHHSEGRAGIAGATRRVGLRWILGGVVSVAVLFYLTGGTPPHLDQWRPLGQPGDHHPPPFDQPPPPPPPPPPPHLPTDTTSNADIPSTTPPPSSPVLDTTSPWPSRAAQVKAAFVHAYSGYEKYSFPHDELLPVNNMSQDNFNGWGVTAVDSLDTMLLMGLHDEFDRAVKHITTLNFKADRYIGFFEPVIRYLGGLISAYALSKNPLLLSRADDLGRHMLPAFQTISGLPAASINLKTGATSFGWQGAKVFLAEIGSCQLEFRALAHYTGRAEYAKAVDRVSEHLRTLKVKEGLYPLTYKIEGGIPEDNKAAVGGYADSAYEYFLKGWLLTNRTEDRWRDMYLTSAAGIIDNLVYLSPKRELLYVTDSDAGRTSGKLEHLSCFLPGLLALGVHTLPEDILPVHERQRHLWVAEGLAHTCWLTYADFGTGLGPDEVWFGAPVDAKGEVGPGGALWVDALAKWKEEGAVGQPPGTGQAPPKKEVNEREYWVRSSNYLLRPETVESFYILWRVTGDAKWRERGWAVFEALEKNAKTASGYASVWDVSIVPPILKNEMPSYFLAETLKYLYLLFTDEELIPLDRWVFNTEAHPIPVFEWSKWEKQSFNIL